MNQALHSKNDADIFYVTRKEGEIMIIFETIF